jgi:hypothetical protein
MILWFLWPVWDGNTDFPTWTTIKSIFDGWRVLWVPSFSYYFWSSELLRFDENFSHSQFAPGETANHFRASLGPLSLASLCSGNHQMELLLSSGPAGGQVLCTSLSLCSLAAGWGLWLWPLELLLPWGDHTPTRGMPQVDEKKLEANKKSCFLYKPNLTVTQLWLYIFRISIVLKVTLR